jgi:hypothetical protein
MASKYYKVNEKNKTVTIDTTVVPTISDKDLVTYYVAGGYKLRVKSEKRAALARERVKNNGGKIKKDKKEKAE